MDITKFNYAGQGNTLGVSGAELFPLANTACGNLSQVGCITPNCIIQDPSSANNECCVPVISGCTDPMAYNYLVPGTDCTVNIDCPNTDDSSCCYVSGCNDSTYCEYVAGACNSDPSQCLTLQGCTDAAACNYDPNATCSGSSICLSCGDDTAWNYDHLTPDASCNVDCKHCNPPQNLTVSSTTDVSGNVSVEFDWDHPVGQQIVGGCSPSGCRRLDPITLGEGPTSAPTIGYFMQIFPTSAPSANFTTDPANFAPPSITGPPIGGYYNHQVNLGTHPSGYPTLLSSYSWGGGSPESHYLVLLSTKCGLSLNISANFSQQEFLVTNSYFSTPAIPPTNGCTNPLACNYDSTASVDDGSCHFLCVGCMNTMPGGWSDINGNDSNGNACTPPCANGFVADNYDPAATISGDATVYGWLSQGCNLPPGFGCTNPSACNYDSTAGTDDGSCVGITSGTGITIQPQPVLSCWESANWNTSTCAWEVTGAQDPAPTNLTSCETVTFNTTTCAWDVTYSHFGCVDDNYWAYDSTLPTTCSAWTSMQATACVDPVITMPSTYQSFSTINYSGQDFYQLNVEFSWNLFSSSPNLMLLYPGLGVSDADSFDYKVYLVNGSGTMGSYLMGVNPVAQGTNISNPTAQTAHSHFEEFYPELPQSYFPGGGNTTPSAFTHIHYQIRWVKTLPGGVKTSGYFDFWDQLPLDMRTLTTSGGGGGGGA
jgi:hypothetical protein